MMHIDNGGGRRRNKQMDVETAVCAVQHIKAYFRQCTDKEVADFGEPCADCKYAAECKFDWFAKMKPLFEKADITIQLGRRGHSDK